MPSRGPGGRMKRVGNTISVPEFGIGTRTSHGCFRMFNNNVLEMADMVPVGHAPGPS